MRQGQSAQQAESAPAGKHTARLNGTDLEPSVDAFERGLDIERTAELDEARETVPGLELGIQGVEERGC